MNRTVAFVLIIIGVVMLVWNTFTYTRRENVVNAGPIHISADKQHTIAWSPIAGGVILVAGIVILVTAKKTV